MQSTACFVAGTDGDDARMSYVKQNFCGRVISLLEEMPAFKVSQLVFFAGDKEHAPAPSPHLFVVQEYSTGFTGEEEGVLFVRLGQLPLNIHGLGVYWPEFFVSCQDWVSTIEAEHDLAPLQEGDKANFAIRKGCYVTAVTEEEQQLRFRLLRCSTNFGAPTENIRATDMAILKTLNELAPAFFKNCATLNHELIQVYRPRLSEKKEQRASIKPHSDKSEDFSARSVIAFCSFYEGYRGKGFPNRPEWKPRHPFDWVYRETSILTRLVFRSKTSSSSRPDSFEVVVHPGSIFMIPEEVNRQYVHEVKNSVLPIDKYATRLSVVARCSRAEAVFREGMTLLQTASKKYQPLHAASPEDVALLKQLYLQENTQVPQVIYPFPLLFSLNRGDYMKPQLFPGRWNFIEFQLEMNNHNIFAQLNDPDCFEIICKGREGGVIVQPQTQGVPVFRSTTIYRRPPTSFKEVHRDIANAISQRTDPSFTFNNALIEKYRADYKKMAFHTDQMQDAAMDSVIAIFSCYSTENPKHLRVLEVKHKTLRDLPPRSIVLKPGSVVLFDLRANAEHLHTIRLPEGKDDTTWLGLTLRLSRTFEHLRLATPKEAGEIRRCKGNENAQIDFEWPASLHNVTLSPSDLPFLMVYPSK